MREVMRAFLWSLLVIAAEVALVFGVPRLAHGLPRPCLLVVDHDTGWPLRCYSSTGRLLVDLSGQPTVQPCVVHQDRCRWPRPVVTMYECTVCYDLPPTGSVPVCVRYPCGG